MDDIQAVQGAEYAFPYHYLAQPSDGSFRSYRAWDWSLSYVTALRLVTERLERAGARSLIDIGCGDGALVHFLHDALPQLRVSGIDFDERPIAFAKLLTPAAEFVAGDIAKARWDQPFDAATLIEVIEHIPPAELAGFMRAVRRVVDGRLILTVPHANMPVEPKHYQHFTFDSLRAVLEPEFEVEEMFGFDRKTSLKSTLQKLTHNRLWFADIRPLNRMLLQSELSFRDGAERNCARIFAVARPKNSP